MIDWNQDKTFEYGERMLFSPRARPDTKKYSELGTDINLIEDGVNLVGPFKFTSPVGAAESSSLIPRTA